MRADAYCARLRGQIDKLNTPGRRLLATLLSGRLADCGKTGGAGEQLLLSGLAREDRVGELRLLRLKNWVIESGLRYHWASLSDLLEGDVYTAYGEFVPPITCLNRDAYRFICEIENLLRNFAIERLHLYAHGQHPLQIVPYAGNDKYKHDNEYESADAWRTRTATREYVSTHSATSSFSTTPQVQAWIDHLRRQYKDPLSSRFVSLEKDMAAFRAIRDAVNHNQIISEESYATLLRIREALYRALSEE